MCCGAVPRFFYLLQNRQETNTDELDCGSICSVIPLDGLHTFVSVASKAPQFLSESDGRPIEKPLISLPESSGTVIFN